jgi:HD-GYP domain-containing protein (c-di-GMP phosphodiesterase class II)
MDRLHDEHYVRAVTRMGDERAVVTNQPIFTRNRIKLVNQGARVDSALFDRLVSHKLIPRIDECLDVENGITRQVLRDDARKLLDDDPALAVLRADPGLLGRTLRAIDEIPLTPPIAFKLTVAASQRPEVYNHSLRVTLVALHLAVKSFFLSQKELTNLAAAALLHDIGILHIPPDLLRPGRRLQKSERHHLYAHPISGYLILRQYAEYHPEISRTVFEHHERLDGSGYPRGLKGGEISRDAQILMLAEVANTVFESSPQSQNLAKLSVLLRLNHKKFNRDLGNRLIALVAAMQSGHREDDDHSTAFANLSRLPPRLDELAHVFSDWSETFRTFSQSTKNAATSLISLVIDERLAELRRTLSDAGFDLDQVEAVADAVSEDPEALVELNILIGETRWQLTDIIHEAYRRMSDALNDSAGMPLPPPILGWLERSETRLSQYPRDS